MRVPETEHITDRTPVPLATKLNPIWWLHGPDGWEVPEANNGQPYLPEVKNIWLRRFYWFFARNPLMNFVGFVIGVEDHNYSVTGTAPVLRTTGRDTEPQQIGWRTAVIRTSVSPVAGGITALAILLVWLVPWMVLLLWPAIVVASLRAAGRLPYVSYWGFRPALGRWLEFYLGWRPHSGGFGLKIVWAQEAASQWK